MNPLLNLALSNLVVASVLAGAACAAGHWGRRPALTHGLWLLVLLKLLTPPLFRVPVGDWLPRTPEATAQAPLAFEPAPLPQPVDEPAPLPLFDVEIAWDELWNVEMVLWDELLAPAPILVVAPPEPVVAAASTFEIQPVLVALWAAGSLLWVVVAVSRVRRFQRLLRHAEDAPPEVTALAESLADKLQIDCPQVCVVPGVISPMLWVMGRSAKLILPQGLLARLTTDQRTTLLAHELAHWKRRDHWVRWLEMAALAAYWWCPLAWWAKRELQQAEEECCDAWVVSVLPGEVKAYALALVETVDFLAGAPATLPPAASGIGQVRSLQRRLTMILRGQTPRALTSAGLLGLAGAGLLILPLVPNWSASTAQDTAPPRKERAVDGPKEGPKERPGDRPNDRPKDRPKDRPDDRPEGRERKDQPGADDLRRAQAELEQARARLDMMRAELDRREQELRRIMEQIRNQPQPKPKPGPGIGGPGPGGIPGGPGIGGPGPGGPGGPGMPGMMGGGGMMPPGGPNLDRRLTEIERKLEILINEMQKQRGQVPPMGDGNPRRPNVAPRDPNAPSRPSGSVPPAPPAPGGRGADLVDPMSATPERSTPLAAPAGGRPAASPDIAPPTRP